MTSLPKYRYIFFGSNRFEKSGQKLCASLLLPTAFAFGADIIADYEYAEIGVTTANWAGEGYSFLACLLMMAVDTVLYALLYAYLDRALPSKYGSHEPPFFFLSPRWWRCSDDESPSSERALVPQDSAFEPVADPACPAIEIVALRKTYGWGALKKVAVDSLSLSMYKGQLTCLLGHNGAGKTSTLSVLTGLYRPTSGDVCLRLFDLPRDAARLPNARHLPAARRSLADPHRARAPAALRHSQGRPVSGDAPGRRRHDGVTRHPREGTHLFAGPLRR